MKTTIFTGSGVALATPFTEDAVDLDLMRRRMEWQITQGTDALIVLGTTGEPATMSQREKDEVVELALDVSNGRVPVIVGCGSNDTVATIAHAQRAERLGAQALLIVTPYYNRPSQAGLAQHYLAVADAVNTPIILYNVPSRTGVNMLPETLYTLSRHKNIVALKEANGDVPQLQHALALVGRDFGIYAGNDDAVLSTMALGGLGVISVAANIIPRDMHLMAKSFLSGDVVGCRNLQIQYAQLIKLLFIEPSPAPLKCAMRLMGMDSGRLRLPLCPVTEATESSIQRELERLGLYLPL